MKNYYLRLKQKEKILKQMSRKIVYIEQWTKMWATQQWKTMNNKL